MGSMNTEGGAAGRETLIDPTSARPGPYRGVGSELVRWLSLLWLRAGGWTLEGDWPDEPKLVVLAAPHTSNWDGLNMLAAAGAYRVKLRWMGKHTLARGLAGAFMLRFGLVPIDRSQSTDMVRAMREEFARRASMILAIPPEATRSLTREWKSGFYHIAVAAETPILLSILDYGERRIRLKALYRPGGDYDAELAEIRRHYDGAVGRRKDRFSAS